MKIGLLWYDDNPRHSLLHKIRQAAGRYRVKFGREPDTCYVHPDVLDKENTIGGIRVKARRSILPGHLWIGQEEQCPT